MGCRSGTGWARVGVVTVTAGGYLDHHCRGGGWGVGVGGEKTSRLRTMVELEPLGDVRSSMRGPARFSLGISSWPLERTLIIMP